TALKLPVHTLHLDLVRCPSQLNDILESKHLSPSSTLSLGVVDGRNIWKNDYQQSMGLIKKAIKSIGEERIMIAPSCSLIHTPCDLESETVEETLPAEVKQWLAFAKQKLTEIADLKNLVGAEKSSAALSNFQTNQAAIAARRSSPRIHNEQVKQRMKVITEADGRRKHPFALRKEAQKVALGLPLFPTTTIGSFPQTAEVRTWRSRYKKGAISISEYEAFLKEETEKAIRWQEK